jgi:hypothetical protein
MVLNVTAQTNKQRLLDNCQNEVNTRLGISPTITGQIGVLAMTEIEQGVVLFKRSDERREESLVDISLGDERT